MLKVRDIMRTEVLTVNPDTPVRRLTRLLAADDKDTGPVADKIEVVALGIIAMQPYTQAAHEVLLLPGGRVQRAHLHGVLRGLAAAGHHAGDLPVAVLPAAVTCLAVFHQHRYDKRIRHRCR